MNDVVLLDTNIVSYFYNKNTLFDLYQPILEGKTKLISHITMEEMLFGAYLRKWGGRRIAELLEFLESFTIVYPGELTTRISAYLRASQRSFVLDLPDAMIAAAAIAEGIPLVSHNAKHFRKIPNLTLLTQSQT